MRHRKPSHSPMASEAYRLTARYKFLCSEVDELEARLEHRRDDLLKVTDRLAEIVIARETDGDPPMADRKPSPPPTSHPSRQAGASGRKEVPDYSSGPYVDIDDRVKVLVRGKYKGRVGTVDSLYGDGKAFVQVLLDPLPGRAGGESTKKAPTSLQKLKWVEDA